ncbi:MAG: hypothetical protein Q9157_002183 [Trypethelium eluteriae]
MVMETPSPEENHVSQKYDKVLQQIVDYVFHYKIDNEKAWKRAKLALLDALGCAVATAASNEDCRKMIGPVVEGTTVPNGARVLGSNFELDPTKAAFDNGLLIRYLDHNDAFIGAEWGHPSDNLGAIISVMDWLSRKGIPQRPRLSDLSSKTGIEPSTTPPYTLRILLTAQIKAYEIQGCFQIRNSFNKVGLDHVILVKLASTAVVSWLMGLDYAQTLAAVSQVWQDGNPLRTYRQAPNTSPRKGWAAGDACMRAVHLALLTRAGQPGAPSVLTAPKWGFYATTFRGSEFSLPQPFGTWVIENVYFKIVAAEAHGITAIYAALQLCRIFADSGINPRKDIARIDIRTHSAAKTIIDKSGPLNNYADRDHCMQYLVAVALLKGSIITPEDYKDDSPWASDTDVSELCSKIVLSEDESFTLEYNDPSKRQMTNGLTVTLKNGKVLDEIVVHHIAGHPLSAETEAEVISKFKRHMSSMFEEFHVRAALEAIEDDDIAVHDLVDLFVMRK